MILLFLHINHPFFGSRVQNILLNEEEKSSIIEGGIVQMGFTTLVALIVLVWAIKTICSDLGLTSALRKKIDREINDDDY